MPSLKAVITHPTLDESLEYWIPEGKAVVFGRNKLKSHFVIPVQSVSRKHFVLKFQGAQVVVQDLGSSQGTYLNGSRIEGSAKIQLQAEQSAAIEIAPLKRAKPPEKKREKAKEK